MPGGADEEAQTHETRPRTTTQRRPDRGDRLGDPDRVAYDPTLAIPAMVEFTGADGRWSLDFSLWNAYANDSYLLHLGTPRHAIDRIRETHGLEPV